MEQTLIDRGYIRGAVKVQSLTKLFEIFPLSNLGTQRKKPKKKQRQLEWIEKILNYEFRSLNLIQSESGTVRRIFELEERAVPGQGPDARWKKKI